jgi:hypothetical protein
VVQVVGVSLRQLFARCGQVGVFWQAQMSVLPKAELAGVRGVFLNAETL